MPIWNHQYHQQPGQFAADTSKISEMKPHYVLLLLPKQIRTSSRQNLPRIPSGQLDSFTVTRRISHNIKTHSYFRTGIPRRANWRNCCSPWPNEPHHRERSSAKPTTRGKRAISRTRFHVRPGNPHIRNGGKPRHDWRSVYPLWQQTTTNPRKIQTGS